MEDEESSDTLTSAKFGGRVGKGMPAMLRVPSAREARRESGGKEKSDGRGGGGGGLLEGAP